MSPDPQPRQLLAILGVFPPAGGAGAIRLAKLMKYLKRQGWQVTAVAPQAGQGWFCDDALVTQTGGVQVHRVGWRRRLGQPFAALRAAAKDPSKRGLYSLLLRTMMRGGKQLRNHLAVPDEYLVWAALAATKAVRLARAHRFDALLTSSFPYSTHLAGKAVKAATGLPWLAELRDPWAGHPFRGDHGRLRSSLDRLLESAVLRHADAVSVVSPGMRILLAERYGEGLEGKLAVLPNGFDPEDFAVQPRVPRRSGLFEVLYVGSLEATLEPPGPLLDALARVVEQDDEARKRLRLRVMGGMDLDSSREVRAWMSQSRHQGLLQLDGFVPHQRAIQAMGQADLLVLIQRQGARVYTAKVFEYLASGRPIAAMVGHSDCRALLEECGGATLFAPEDSAGLAAYLLRSLGKGEAVPAIKANPTALQDYSLPRLAEAAAARLEALVAPELEG